MTSVSVTAASFSPVVQKMNSKWLWLLSLSIVGILVACSTPTAPHGDRDGIGGTGVVAQTEPDGIGGTGLVDPTGDGDDGIGGTGVWPGEGDVALYGVITNLNPLVINGHGMFVDDSTVVSLNGEKSGTDALVKGGVAWAKAGIRGGAVKAIELFVQSAVRGPIEDYVEPNKAFIVRGQFVQLTRQTEIEVAGLHAGMWVEIAGIRDHEGNIQASLVMPADEQQPALAQSTQAASQLPFQGEVGVYSMQTYAKIDDGHLSLSHMTSALISLEVPDKAANRVRSLVTEQAVVVEFKPVGNNRFQFTTIREAIDKHPNQTIIPQYRPPMPNGMFAPGLGVQQLPSPSADDIGRQIDTDIDRGVSIPTQAKVTAPPPPPPSLSEPPTRVIDRVPASVKTLPSASPAPSVDALPAIGPSR